MTAGSDIFFIDLEASGLGAQSWPIEVGWCGLSGRPQAMLIKPDDAWPVGAWDPAAQDLHGISRGKLDRAGKPTPDVCAALNKALAGHNVYSDAPDWDGFWLYRLFGAARVKQEFKLLHFADLFAGASPETFASAKARAQDKAPHRHRAKDDVVHMRLLFELAGAASGN